MSLHFKPTPLSPPDARGYVEALVAGRAFEVAWSLRGEEVRVVGLGGQLRVARRDPGRGSVQDQARGMALELWLAVNGRGAVSRPG
jgi:hypothetical protein